MIVSRPERDDEIIIDDDDVIHMPCQDTSLRTQGCNDSTGTGGTSTHVSDSSDTPSDLQTSPEHSPYQPLLARFPPTFVGEKYRSFSSNWYKKYTGWNIRKKGTQAFVIHVVSRGDGAFTKYGFRNWKHATGKTGILAIHDRCSAHLPSVEAWSQY